MSLVPSLSEGFRSLFRKERVEGELDEEVRAFLDLAAEEKMKQGMSRKDALRACAWSGAISKSRRKRSLRTLGSFVETCWQDFALCGTHVA